MREKKWSTLKLTKIGQKRAATTTTTIFVRFINALAALWQTSSLTLFLSFFLYLSISFHLFPFFCSTVFNPNLATNWTKGRPQLDQQRLACLHCNCTATQHYTVKGHILPLHSLLSLLFLFYFPSLYPKRTCFPVPSTAAPVQGSSYGWSRIGRRSADNSRAIRTWRRLQPFV